MEDKNGVSVGGEVGTRGKEISPQRTQGAERKERKKEGKKEMCREAVLGNEDVFFDGGLRGYEPWEICGILLVA